MGAGSAERGDGGWKRVALCAEMGDWRWEMEEDIGLLSPNYSLY
jgi:hypothetical protein